MDSLELVCLESLDRFIINTSSRIYYLRVVQFLNACSTTISANTHLVKWLDRSLNYSAKSLDRVVVLNISVRKARLSGRRVSITFVHKRTFYEGIKILLNPHSFVA